MKLVRAILLACAVLVAPGAMAQLSSPQEQAQLRKTQELMRKAEAGERENGICATLLHWPLRTSVDDFFRYLDDGRIGAEFFARSRYPSTGGCSYYRVKAQLASPENHKCWRTSHWSCFDFGSEAGKCSALERVWCRDPASGWKLRRDL